MPRKTLLTPGGHFGARWNEDHAVIEVWHMPSGLRATVMHHFIRSLRTVAGMFAMVEAAAPEALATLEADPANATALAEVRRAIRANLEAGTYG